MANFTPNLNLKKPLQTENYDVDDFNGNADIIDTQIGNLKKIALGAVEDLAALKAIDTTNLPDNITVIVKTLGFYRFDKTSTLTPNGTSIVQPTAGPGRWLNDLAAHLADGAYHSQAMSRQAIIDGNFQIAQAVPVPGTEVTNPVSGSYPVFDVWKTVATPNGGTAPNIKHKQRPLTPGSIEKSDYCYSITVDGAGSNFGRLAEFSIYHYIEHGFRYLMGAGKKVVLSFFARSSISNKKLGYCINVRPGTGGSPSGGGLLPGKGYVTLTNDWKRYSVVMDAVSLSGVVFGTNKDDSLELMFWMAWGSDQASYVNATAVETFVGAGDIEIAQVQLNAGDVALPFEPKSFADELRACQRYFEKSLPYSLIPNFIDAGNPFPYYPLIGSYANMALSNGNFKAEKRKTPTITIYNPKTGVSNAVYDILSGADITNLSSAGATSSGLIQIFKQGAFTAGQTYTCNWTADARF